MRSEPPRQGTEPVTGWRLRTGEVRRLASLDRGGLSTCWHVCRKFCDGGVVSPRTHWCSSRCLPQSHRLKASPSYSAGGGPSGGPAIFTLIVVAEGPRPICRARGASSVPWRSRCHRSCCSRGG